jgi:long-chain acyl-CoA synthetase
LPIDGVEMRVVDDDGAEVPQGEVGEIAIRGHNVMKGYWRRPEATAEAIDPAGWFQDRRPRPRGRRRLLFIVDRKKEMIIRGGFNVYPREIEELLYEHPAVRQVAVIGIPHPELGEEVAAAVVLKRTPT